MSIHLKALFTSVYRFERPANVSVSLNPLPIGRGSSRPPLRRTEYRFNGFSLVFWALAAFLWAGPARIARAGDEFWAGADISGLPDIEKAGGKFRDAGKERDAISILHDHGINLFRIRLFVNPNRDYARTGGATQDLDAVRSLARRVKASGSQFLLDLHYSDTWADPGHQAKPAAWEQLAFDALEQKVHDYSAEVMASLIENGTPPDMVQIGNEVAAGILWPEGKLNGKTEPDKQRQWDRFSRLIKAGVRAVREAGPKDHPARVVIHIQSGGRPGLPKWFFANLTRCEVDYDLIGLSFYPTWDDSLDALRNNLDQLARTYKKDILVLETAYPSRGPPPKAAMPWPLTPQGQAQFAADLIAAVRAAPDHHGRGVVWWYPESIPVPGLQIWEGGSNALFDETGNALPALREFEKWRGSQ